MREGKDGAGPMEMSPAKRRILEISLELFSKYGYEATSVGLIAEALGIKKPSLYSHFSSKQEIFDTIVQEAERHFGTASRFVIASAEEAEAEYARLSALTAEELAEEVCRQVRFLLHDPMIARVRRLMIIEQFRNPALCALQEKHSYTDILHYHTGWMRYLLDHGLMKPGDAELLALQYTAPVSAELSRIDRDGTCEEEALCLIRAHVIDFTRTHRKEARS